MLQTPSPQTHSLWLQGEKVAGDRFGGRTVDQLGQDAERFDRAAIRHQLVDRVAQHLFAVDRDGHDRGGIPRQRQEPVALPGLAVEQFEHRHVAVGLRVARRHGAAGGRDGARLVGEAFGQVLPAGHPENGLDPGAGRTQAARQGVQHDRRRRFFGRQENAGGRSAATGLAGLEAGLEAGRAWALARPASRRKCSSAVAIPYRFVIASSSGWNNWPNVDDTREILSIAGDVVGEI